MMASMPAGSSAPLAISASGPVPNACTTIDQPRVARFYARTGIAAVWMGDLLYRDHFAAAAGVDGGGGWAVAGNWMPSPYFATSGMVMGRCPRMGISPNSAFTAATSAGGT